jgi:Fe-S oxidoreductase
MEDFLEKYRWFIEDLNKAEKPVKRKIFNNLRLVKKNFFPSSEYKEDVENLINCALCPNMCRFDCGTLQASRKETMSPAYKSRIGYYIAIGKIDPFKEENKDFVDLMYKCTNEENCKIWCPFNFSVVSLLETVRDGLNDKGLMPDYCKEQIKKLQNTGTIEDFNIFKTYEEKGIENIETDGNDEVFYYIGCEMMKFPEVVKANIQILKKARVKFSTNLEEKVCCAAPALNIRDFEISKRLASKNIELIKKTGAKIIVSDCPGCVYTLTRRYEKNGFENSVKVTHIAEYFNDLIKKKMLAFRTLPEKFHKVTIHDPCLLARNLDDKTSIRALLKNIPNIEINEPLYNKENTHCCGWSGTAHWADKDLAIKEATLRIQELEDTGANIIVSACPTCELGLGYGLSKEKRTKFKILDISELLIKALE